MIKRAYASAVRATVIALMVAPAIVAGPAWALDPPPTDPDKCGGLVCDLGLYGGARDPHALPCNDFVCRVFGGKSAQPAPPPPEPVATEPAADVTPKARHARTRTKHMAAKATGATATPASPPADAAPR